MKKILFVATALYLLTLSSAMAEPTHPNEIGLYTTPDGYGPTGTDVTWAPVEVYLVLTKPTDLSADGGPISNVLTLECQLNFNPVPDENLYMQSFTLMAEGLNIGDTTDIQQGFLEYIVGFSTGVPVIDESAVLITIEFINLSSTIFEVTLGPTSGASVPGEMTFGSDDFGPILLFVMHPVSGSFDAPVFIFNGVAVPVETESFGSVKALYR